MPRFWKIVGITKGT